jgi:hypothetical protein
MPQHKGTCSYFCNTLVLAGKPRRGRDSFPAASWFGLTNYQLPVFGLIAEPTKENVLLALEPSVVMAEMHTTIISASMTAYSTAVGPSSDFKKFIDTRSSEGMETPARAWAGDDVEH